VLGPLHPAPTLANGNRDDKRKVLSVFRHSCLRMVAWPARRRGFPIKIRVMRVERSAIKHLKFLQAIFGQQMTNIAKPGTLIKPLCRHKVEMERVG